VAFCFVLCNSTLRGSTHAPLARTFQHCRFRRPDFALIIAVVTGTQRKTPPQPDAASLRAPVELAAAGSAPKFPPGLPAQHGKAALAARLARKIVLLDFWTYGCINGLHILPDLKKRERKYANEPWSWACIRPSCQRKRRANIRNAYHALQHRTSVLVDKGDARLELIRVNACQRLWLIDPAGNVVDSRSEGNFGVLGQHHVAASRSISPMR
jgi:hypothetical protein